MTKQEHDAKLIDRLIKENTEQKKELNILRDLVNGLGHCTADTILEKTRDIFRYCGTIKED